MASKEQKVYFTLAKRLFNTPDGMEILKYWKENYFDPSAVVVGDPSATMFALGKKELVQELMSHVKEQDALFERIKIETDEMETPV